MKPKLSIVAVNGAKTTESNAPVSLSSFKQHIVTAGRLAGVVALGVLKGMRYALFYVLMWLRVVVHAATTFFCGIGLLTLVLMFLVYPDKSIMLKLAGFSFACFVIGWIYDGLLLMVSPEPMMLDGRPTNNF